MTAAPWPTHRRDRRVPAAAAPLPAVSGIERAIATLAFALLLGANMSLMSMRMGGIPLRSFMTVGMLGLFVLLYPVHAQRLLAKIALPLALGAGLALQGLLVSLANGAPLGAVLQKVSEIHLQMMVVLFLAVLLGQLAGLRNCVAAFVLVVLASGIVASLQFSRVDAAWALRKALGPLANDELEPFKIEQRPTGLAYSPIQLSTHLCLAFAVFTAGRDRLRAAMAGRVGADPAVLAAVGVFVVLCIVSETRSPLLGVAIFLGVYLIARRNWWLFLALFGGGILALFLWPLIMAQIEAAAPRVVSVEDKSAAARLVFLYYGTRLFLDNPLGYGLTFRPEDLWHDYWADLYLMRGAAGVQIHDLHNFFLSMLNIHGIGIFLFVPIVVVLLRRARASLIYFIPYIVHITFHNSGPFYNDTIIWIAVGALSAPVLARALPAPVARRRTDVQQATITVSARPLAPEG